VPYFKVYEKPLLTNLNYHTFLFSSTLTGTTLYIEKHINRHPVFHFYLLMYGSSDIAKRKRCTEFSLSYYASRHWPRGRIWAKRGHEGSEGTFRGRLGSGQQSEGRFSNQLHAVSKREVRLVMLDPESTEGTTAVENLCIEVSHIARE